MNLFGPYHPPTAESSPSLAACVAPVVAPRLFRGAYGTLRERKVAGHLPLDRQGQRKSAHHYRIGLQVLAMETRNWRVSVDNEFLHITPHNLA